MSTPTVAVPRRSRPGPRGRPAAVDQVPPATSRVTIRPRHVGWAALGLIFLSSAGMYVLLASSMAVRWPLPLAAVSAALATGCIGAALRDS